MEERWKGAKLPFLHFLLYLGPQWIGLWLLTLVRAYLLNSVYWFKYYSLPVTSETHPEIIFYQLSGYPSIPSSWYIRLTITNCINYESIIRDIFRLFMNTHGRKNSSFGIRNICVSHESLIDFCLMDIGLLKLSFNFSSASRQLRAKFSATFSCSIEWCVIHFWASVLLLLY